MKLNVQAALPNVQNVKRKVINVLLAVEIELTLQLVIAQMEISALVDNNNVKNVVYNVKHAKLVQTIV